MELLGNWVLQLQVLATTAYAMLLGGAIGFERELKNRPAGFRTHMLVAGACAMLVGLVDLIALRFAGEAYRELVRSDPIRLIERPSPRSDSSARARYSGVAKAGSCPASPRPRRC